MLLNRNAINLIKTNTALRFELCAVLNYSERWLLKLIVQNKKNGPLTTYAALLVISQHSNLAFDQILIKDELKIPIKQYHESGKSQRKPNKALSNNSTLLKTKKNRK